MNYFFVFQKETFLEESEGGFLWSPQFDYNGRQKSHWSMMKNVKKGDVIIHSVNKEIVAISVAKGDCYSSQRPEGKFNEWEKEGWRIDVEYTIFSEKIITSDHRDKLLVLQPTKYAPFDYRGRGNLGYLFAANKEMFEYIVNLTAQIQKDSETRQSVLDLLEISKNNNDDVEIYDYDDLLPNTKSMWKELLDDDAIFNSDDIKILAQIYSCPGHATTCKDLGIKNNCHPTSFITPITSLARRVLKARGLNPTKKDNGENSLWPVLFHGKYINNDLFEWRIKKELSQALVEKYPDIDSSKNNRKIDDELINDINNFDLSQIKKGFTYKGKAKPKGEVISEGLRLGYKRDRQTSINALAKANFLCEIDGEHQSFIRKSSDLKYTEPHHLVPMAYSDEFDVSLDVEENIVSLCSNCHNHLHYGKDIELQISNLYNERKAYLEQAGIRITLEGLMEMYE